MERVYKSLSTTVVEVADTLTTGVTALHYIANGACSRAMVIEEKAEAGAAMSALESRHDIALRLKDLQEFEKDNPELLNKADAFIAAHRLKRANRNQPQVESPQPVKRPGRPKKS